MSFSERQGIIKKNTEFQTDSINIELRNRIWNIFDKYIVRVFTRHYSLADHLTKEATEFIDYVNDKFFKETVDYKVDYPYTEFRNRVFNLPWNRLYDFIEFLIKSENRSINFQSLIDELNEVLKEEFSGFRIVNGIVTPIINEIEIDELNQTLEIAQSYPQFKGVDIHINEAMKKLADKKNPDYRNSIKESISAVETLCRILTKESTLGKAIQKLENSGIELNRELKKGIEKLYNYTNNKESGIRHSIINDYKEPSFADAKYLLVMCSAFINYLIGKANENHS